MNEEEIWERSETAYGKEKADWMKEKLEAGAEEQAQQLFDALPKLPDGQPLKPNRAQRRYRRRHHPIFTKKAAWEDVHFLTEVGIAFRDRFIQKRRNKGKKRKAGQKPR